MKKVILSAALGLSATSMAFAILPLGDGSDLFLTGTGVVRYDDNILSSETGKLNDTIFELDPGIQVATGRNAQIKSMLSFTEAITRYASNSGLDTELAKVSLTSNYANDKTKVDFSLGYSQLNQNVPTSGVPGLLRRDTTSGAVKGETALSPKTIIGAGLNYDKSHYKSTGLQDSKTYAVPVNLYYIYTDKLSVFGGMRYRKTDLATLPDYEDYYYSVGARGEFSPVLSGEFGVGLNQRKSPGASTQSGLGLNSSLTYAYSEKTSISLGLNNDFSAASAGQSQETLSFNAGLSTQLTPDWRGNANVVFNNTDYKGTLIPRTDKYYEVSFGLTHQFSPTTSVSGTYTYRDNSSNNTGQSFTDNVLAISAVVRF